MEALESVGMHMAFRLSRFSFRLVLFGSLALRLCGAHALAADTTLCPNLIAALTTVPGNLDAQYAGQRVEIRQCPVDVPKRLGVFQLAAWSKNASFPALVYETEESGFHQFSMIEGVYVFQFIGGTAQPIVAIVFENGVPRLGLRASTLSEPKITSTPSAIVIEYVDSKDNKLHRHEFARSGKTQRKG